MKAPFVYFGGKSSVADIVWDRLGDVTRYIEPFFGSGAVLLNRPDEHKRTYEIACDKDGHIANVWRAIRFAPDEVAKWCDWPVNHADLNARRKVLNARYAEMLPKLAEDPDWFDAKLAGFWVWAASCWIGTGMSEPGTKVPHISDRKGVHAGQVPHLTARMGIACESANGVYEWMRQLSARLRPVAVVCGDWTRVCGGNWQDKGGTVGIFFDPPYAAETGRDMNCYGHTDDGAVAHAVREWAIKRGSRESHRICIAGYDEHEELAGHGWTKQMWKALGGYGNQSEDNKNRHRECLWFSPHCIAARQRDLFAG